MAKQYCPNCERTGRLLERRCPSPYCSWAKKVPVKEDKKGS